MALIDPTCQIGSSKQSLPVPLPRVSQSLGSVFTESQPSEPLQVLQHFCRIAPGGPPYREHMPTQKSSRNDCQSAPSYKKLLADNDPWHSHPLDWKLMQSSLMSPPVPPLPRASELMFAGWLVFWMSFLKPPCCTSWGVSQQWRLPSYFVFALELLFQGQLNSLAAKP